MNYVGRHGYCSINCGIGIDLPRLVITSMICVSVLNGLECGLAGGAFWKVHHLNERRKTEEFYARLEAGEITVAVE